MIRQSLLISLLVSLCFAGYAQDIDYKGFPQWSWHQQDSTEYYLYTPDSIPPGKAIPIVLFMHGCCGVDNHASLRNCVDPPVRMWHQYGANRQSEPTYIIAPATSRGWRQHFPDLKKVMDDLVARHQGDPRRIYVCGFSMGGEGTFQIIHEYPGYFAAAIMMGMSMRSELEPVKDIPLWVNQGETDWFSRDLKERVAAMRHLNGMASDTGGTWVMGVNPRYSNFEGVDHPVQWHAAYTQDLTGWAYKKINDGNRYPRVFFASPAHMQTVTPGQSVLVKVMANDPDGSVAKVELYQNGKRMAVKSTQPFQFECTPVPGDNRLTAIAYDNQGKTQSAAIRIRSNIKPAFTAYGMPAGFAGSWFQTGLSAIGNGEIDFSDAGGRLPDGLILYANGNIKGVPLEAGTFSYNVQIKDEDGETVQKRFQLIIHPKEAGEILVTHARNRYGMPCRVSKMQLGESPNFNSRDSLAPLLPSEINFSGLGKYQGLTCIRTDINDTACAGENCISFNIDQDAVLYVAYEKLDLTRHSSIPAWLNDFHKEDGEIAAQYRYFDVYSKRVSRGHISLPGAEARANGVGTNYFIMLKPLSR